MKIVDSTGAALQIYLPPDDCLLLARACQIAAEHTHDGGPDVAPEQATEAALYDLMARCLEGYAIVGQALATLPPTARQALDPATVRDEWGVLPGDRRDR